jgi:hypothetical protein
MATITNINHPKNINSNVPNLGGLTLKMIAKDDAAFVSAVRVSDVASGRFAMPFLHVWFALSYYLTFVVSEKAKQFAKQFGILFELSRIRNHRLMRKINQVIVQHPDKKQFTVPDDTEFHVARVIAEANACGTDPAKYLDESTDDDDVAQCSNAWCLNQNLTCGKASDNVIIITDLDGIDWFVLITRQNGPGRSQLAWAGGFVDKDETFTQAALREKSEEMGMDITHSASDVKYDIKTTDLPATMMMDWDPRAKFVEGMEVGAVVTHYTFKRV